MSELKVKSDSFIDRFCKALDAEINCHKHHGTTRARNGTCESCPLALWIDVVRRFSSAYPPNLYDAVRDAVRKGIPFKAGQEIVREAVKSVIEGTEGD